MDKNIGQEIVQKQNTENMLRCLAAQRFLYSSAKILFFWQLIFSTIVVIIISIINLYKDISWIIAAYGSIVAIIDVAFLSPLIKKKKERAAKIQELFDTFVLKIEWNDILIGGKPTNEEIHRYSEKYKEKHVDFNDLKNWYSPKISDIDSNAAKIICQRANCTYDYAIRDSFSNAILLILVITSLVIISIGLIKGFTLQNFFLIFVFPLLPAILLFFTTLNDNGVSKDYLDELRSEIEFIWNKLLSDSKINNIEFKVRAIQDKIFLNRKNSPLIFDWYYNKKRNKLESEMHFSVENLVQEYKNR